MDGEVIEIEKEELPFDDALAISLCPNACCQDTLVCSACATAVECKQCGERFSAVNFDDAGIEPIVKPSLFTYLIMRRRVIETKNNTRGFVRMVNRAVDGVHGECHERLLQPFFLHYGWDMSDQTIQLIGLGGKHPLKTFPICTFAIDHQHLTVGG